MITELREVMMNTPKINEPEPLLIIEDLHVWYELRRFGFGHHLANAGADDANIFAQLTPIDFAVTLA